MSGLPRILIGAPRSGAGKTLVTCALLQALKERKKRVVSFKCGPDYIDPMFHREALGIDSDNLDSYFCSEQEVRNLLAEKERDYEMAVIEGVMGYYDGLGGITCQASTYEIARITRTPAILVVDGRGASLSLLPLVQGFQKFREDSQIKGVIFNRISPSIYPLLKETLERETGLLAYGYLPVLEEGVLESRHLGLKLPWEAPDFPKRLKKLAEKLEETVDIDGILELAEGAPKLEIKEKQEEKPRSGSLRIAAAKDEAFCFCYPDNLRFLEERGAVVIPFSPLHDPHFPEDVDGLLLYGGYPELHAKELSENETMRQELQRAVTGGLPCMAECGGFQYLMETMETEEGQRFPMAGVLKGESFPAGNRRFGYIELTGGRLFGKPAGTLRAHEFHYYDSTCCGEAFTARKSISGRNWKCMIGEETMLAGYPHLHYRGNPQVGEAFLYACRKYQRGRNQ